jgi:hypothetical protein
MTKVSKKLWRKAGVSFLARIAQTKEVVAWGRRERESESRTASHDAILRGMLFWEDDVSNRNALDWPARCASDHIRAFGASLISENWVGLYGVLDSYQLQLSTISPWGPLRSCAIAARSHHRTRRRQLTTNS